ESFSVLRRDVSPTERRQPDGRGEQAAKEGRAVFAQFSLGKVDEKHPPLVHDLPDAEILRRSSQETIEKGIRQESTDLVLYRRRAVRAVGEREPVELTQQERPYRLVSETTRDVLPKLPIRQYT